MGIGEAAVTILSEDGVPTPVVHTAACAARVAHGARGRRRGRPKASPLYAKYGTRAEAESAREKLAARMEEPEERDPPSPAGRLPPPKRPPQAQARAGGGDGPHRRRRRHRRLPHLARGQGPRKKVMRGVFGMLRKRL